MKMSVDIIKKMASYKFEHKLSLLAFNDILGTVQTPPEYVSANGHNFCIRLFGTKKMVTLLLKNTGNVAVFIKGVKICRNDSLIHCESLNNLRLDSNTWADLTLKHVWYDCCTFVVEYAIEDDSAPADAVERSCPLGDIAAMQDDDKFADAILECEGFTIPCHRVILAARSEHFRDLFGKEGFVEGQSRKVKIKDMGVATLRHMLKYIYSDDYDVETADHSALFSAAHLFKIPGLLSRCEAAMIKTLSVKNASEFFLKAFLTDCEPLKTAAMDLMYQRFSEIVKTDGWTEFMKFSCSNRALEQLVLYMASRK